MNNTGVSAKRITALLCALVFVLSLALTGCQIGSSDEGNTTTTEPTANQALEYVDPNQGVVCPKCGSSNTDDAWREGEEYDEHFICYDCEYEWYLLNGVAYEIKDNGQSATIPNYTYRPSNNSGSSGNSGNKKPVTTTTKATTTTTTKKGEDTFMFDGKEYTYEQFWKEIVLTGKILNYLNFYIDEEGNITTEGDKGVLGFAYSTKDKCFYASGNAWQRDYGYNELYDKTSQLIAISYDTINVYFPYKNKEWMVQFWKGQYGMVLLGAEIGVYNRSLKASASASEINHYNAVSDSERLPISLTLYQNDKILFSRSQQLSWWQTGFVFGQLGVTGGVLVGSKYTDDLKVTTAITLKDEEMTNAFVTGLKAVSRIYNNVDAMNANDTSAGYRSYSFTQGDGVTPGTYSVSGNTVKLAWR